MAILNSWLSTKNKTIMTSLSPCESSISIPYTPRFRNIPMEDTSIYCFFLFTVDLDLPRQPPVAKLIKNPGGDEPASLGFAFLMQIQTTRTYSSKGRFFKGDLLWNQPKTNPSILGGAQIDPSVNGLSPRIHPATLAWAVRCQASWDIEFGQK